MNCSSCCFVVLTCIRVWVIFLGREWWCCGVLGILWCVWFGFFCCLWYFLLFVVFGWLGFVWLFFFVYHPALKLCALCSNNLGLDFYVHKKHTVQFGLVLQTSPPQGKQCSLQSLFCFSLEVLISRVFAKTLLGQVQKVDSNTTHLL